MTKKLFAYEEETICNFQKNVMDITKDTVHQYQIYNTLSWSRNDNEEKFINDLITLYNNMINKYQKGDTKYYEK